MGKRDNSRYFMVEYSLYRTVNGIEEFVRQEKNVEPSEGPLPKGYWDGFNLRYEFDNRYKHFWHMGRLHRKVYISHEEITKAEWK